ncbi:MAG: NAD-dependent dehydratase [Ramlibacter sp.]|nr:NAD-dependent dehydratase [Ramlibacter sp.]
MPGNPSSTFAGLRLTPLLVTGLTGFVGSHLAQQAGAADLCRDGQMADLRNFDQVAAAVAALRPQSVIHLAAQSSVAQSLLDPIATYQVNFTGTLNLLMALRDSGFRGRMLYVGSGDVYGSVAESLLPVTEDVPLRPRNPYAVSKVAAEALCYQWSQSGPFEIVMARPFNHIGAGQGTQFAVADFARQIVAFRKGRGPDKLTVGDIHATRDFTDVRDIVRAYGELLRAGLNGEAYNVCSGVERSLREIIDALFRTSGVTMEVEIDAQRLRPSEQRRMRGSYHKLRTHTGWEPAVPLEQTLQDILDYWDRKDEV